MSRSLVLTNRSTDAIVRGQFMHPLLRNSLIVSLVIFAGLYARPAKAAIRVADPVWVSIPALRVEAAVQARGTTAAGFMLPPASAWDVAWHVHGVRPGELGGAVMYGHLNTRSSSVAVFSQLHRLGPGNTIRVTDAKNVTRVFKVKKVGRYARTELPISDMTSKSSTARLTLYTCAGTWNPRLGDYSHRLIVFSELLSTTAASLPR